MQPGDSQSALHGRTISGEALQISTHALQSTLNPKQKDKQTMTTQELNEANTSAAEARANNWAKRHNVEATFTFVPFSQSRNKDEKHPSINWKVALTKNDKPIIGPFDYMQGSGHAPSYKQQMRYQVDVDRVAYECEHGKVAREVCGTVRGMKPIATPKLADVLYSLASDTDALDYSSFEDWASSFGYEADSRKAEAIYRTCLEYALKLRVALGDKGLQELRNAVSDM